MKDDYEIKFWKDWLNADPLKRLELAKGLPIFKMSLKMKNTKMWKRAFALLLNGYFEDLESVVYTKIRLENHKRTHQPCTKVHGLKRCVLLGCRKQKTFIHTLKYVVFCFPT